MTPTIAQLALDQWQARLAFARDQARAGYWQPGEAEAKLYPWLAVALRAGATPAEATPEIEHYRRAGMCDRTARTLVAEDLCPWPEMRAELAAARDAAIAAALSLKPAHPEEPPEAASRRAAVRERSHALQSLAIALGCAPTASNSAAVGPDRNPAANDQERIAA